MKRKSNNLIIMMNKILRIRNFHLKMYQKVISKKSQLKNKPMNNTWKFLKNFVLFKELKKIFLNNIGTFVIHVVLQEVMDVVQYVQENVIKDIMLFIPEKVTSFVIVEKEENVRAQHLLNKSQNKNYKKDQEVKETKERQEGNVHVEK